MPVYRARILVFSAADVTRRPSRPSTRWIWGWRERREEEARRKREEARRKRERGRERMDKGGRVAAALYRYNSSK